MPSPTFIDFDICQRMKPLRYVHLMALIDFFQVKKYEILFSRKTVFASANM